MDERLAFDLACASDEELMDELIRRTVNSPGRALIVGFVRPNQEDYTDHDLCLQSRGTDPARMQYLLAHIVKNMGLRGLPDGRVEIPSFTGPATGPTGALDN